MCNHEAAMLRLNNWSLWRRMLCCFPINVTNYDHGESLTYKYICASYVPYHNTRHLTSRSWLALCYRDRVPCHAPAYI